MENFGRGPKKSIRIVIVPSLPRYAERWYIHALVTARTRAAILLAPPKKKEEKKWSLGVLTAEVISHRRNAFIEILPIVQFYATLKGVTAVSSI